MAFNVSQSKIKTYRQCAQAYHYKYVQKLRRISKSRPLQFGTIVHEMLDAFANNKDPFIVLENIAVENMELFEAEREMLGDIMTDIRVIMTEYFDYYKDSEMRFVPINGKRAEHEFKLPLTTEIDLELKLDGLVKAKRLLWLIEHKTHKNLPNEDERWRNLQSAVYLKALLELDFEVDGVVWNYIRSKSPTKPQVLKAGGLSKRKIDTLPTMVQMVIREHRLKEKDHDVLMQRAVNNRESYFTRVYTPVDRRVRDAIFKDAVSTAKEMKTNHGLKKDKNIGRHCSWCDYEPLCRASLTGGDVKFIKEREYVVSEREEKTVETE